MDTVRFDVLVKSLGKETTRRGAVRGLAVIAVGAGTSRLGLADAGAKRRRKRKRCLSDFSTCESETGLPCCAGTELCCPPYEVGGETAPHCAPGGAVCCTPAESGGWCGEGDQCCATSPRWRFGICESAEGECCTDEWWGSCSAGFHCCNEPEPASCCPNEPEVSAASVRVRVTRNYRRRH